MSGATYLSTPETSAAAVLMMALFVPLAFVMVRWLEILPLGSVAAAQLSVRFLPAGASLLVVAAALTAMATVVVGPLSFVGLMAANMARMAGLQRARHQLAGAGLAGASLMICADWLGRVLLVPNQVPAGLVATLAGGPYFIWLMWRGRR